MSGFDKFCAALAFPLAVVLLILGVIGLFTGCKAHFTLPPVLGVVPALVGWGILRAVLVAWQVPASGSQPRRPPRPDRDHPEDELFWRRDED